MSIKYQLCPPFLNDLVLFWICSYLKLDQINAGTWVFIPTDKPNNYLLKNTDSGLVLILNSRIAPMMATASSVSTSSNTSNAGLWQIASTSSGFLIQHVPTKLYLFGSTPVSAVAYTTLSSNCLWNITAK